jgi:1-deoxy-D-xylulose-5-phosphate reductoisomerase
MSAGVAVLGSTGSIGRSTLNVLERQSEHFHAVALTANSSAELLKQQAATAGAKFVGLVNPNGAGRVDWLSGSGIECLIEAATHPDVDIVVNAVVGAAGLQATLAALNAGKRVALANKESLVMAGELVNEAIRTGGGELVPVDSEHSAVLQCITGYGKSEVARLILTASGGPFRQRPSDEVRQATAEQALKHPTWEMGRKITVDSATLANKALEVIEAHYLFGLDYEQVEVVVHPQSIIHSFVDFVDGSILAQVGFPNMELPILYALTHPGRLADSGVRRFDPVAAGDLEFEEVRYDAFPTFGLGVDAGKIGGTAPAVFNAANEVAVRVFLDGGMRLGGIPDVIENVLNAHQVEQVTGIETVVEADRWAREKAELICSQ